MCKLSVGQVLTLGLPRMPVPENLVRLRRAGNLERKLFAARIQVRANLLENAMSARQFVQTNAKAVQQGQTVPIHMIKLAVEARATNRPYTRRLFFRIEETTIPFFAQTLAH